jgi:hypothetical protein
MDSQQLQSTSLQVLSTNEPYRMYCQIAAQDTTPRMVKFLLSPSLTQSMTFYESINILNS